MEKEKKRIRFTTDNFKALRTDNCYYVDKTGLIKDLITKGQPITLITRPRRFGKSLNMSMLANFFSMDGDKHIFDGLKISEEKEICDEYMGKYPVIFLTLKGIETSDFNRSYHRLIQLITEVAGSFYYLAESGKLNEQDKSEYMNLLDKKMDESTLCSSLKNLCKFLEKHFDKKPILLIDEYDVPLNKAYLCGYYDRMIELIRGLLGDALKSNDNIEFAVLTGCLRVSKESFFTGLNNLDVRSVKDTLYSGYFGFTDEEVRDMLDYYGLSEHYDTIKEWYDGYQFGDTRIYCPWDVLKYCYDLTVETNPQPDYYWINTSSNDIIGKFLSMTDGDTRDDIGRLLAGETIVREIHEDLTYQDMYSNINNLWSLLYMTGYLTQHGVTDEGKLRLAFSNFEILDTFDKRVRQYLKDCLKADPETLNKFYKALQDGDAETVEELFTAHLDNSISVRDYAEKKDRQEAFYHGTLTGILAATESWEVLSNREAGDGYADILVKSKDGNTGLVIEMKHVDSDNKMDNACLTALKQIEDRRYASCFSSETTTIRKYAIVCFRKRCRVMLGK